MECEKVVSTTYLNTFVIPWEELINGTKNITMWFKSSNGWLKTYKKKLQELIEKGGNIVAFLPDFQDNVLMDDIVKVNSPYYNDSRPEIAIKESIEHLESLCTNGRVIIYLYRNQIQYPAYVFDEKVLYGIHEHRKIGNVTSPCTLIPRIQFIDDQIEGMKLSSYEWNPYIKLNKEKEEKI